MSTNYENSKVHQTRNLTSLIANLFCSAMVLTSVDAISSERKNWNIRTQQDNITVHTRNVENSNIDAFKASTVIGAHYEKVKEVILDYPNYPFWYEDYDSGEVLKQLNQEEFIVRFVIDAPFPFKDRDSVNRVLIQETDNFVKIVLESLSTYAPPTKKHIRMFVSSGHWKLEKQDNQTRVTLEYHADPRIPIPSWISNRYIVQGPAKSLANLRKNLE